MNQKTSKTSPLLKIVLPRHVLTWMIFSCAWKVHEYNIFLFEPNWTQFHTWQRGFPPWVLTELDVAQHHSLIQLNLSETLQQHPASHLASPNQLQLWSLSDARYNTGSYCKGWRSSSIVRNRSKLRRVWSTHLRSNKKDPPSPFWLMLYYVKKSTKMSEKRQ